ncbi:hypothetical protein [Bradyrhizobium sp. STM 3843]|uniref:hypothetical protein n=2 Tax=unclassified Bradyrhizobium TaxID=2631580 RepID=UPI001FCBCB65|nr:hypothetical protein [Bradyrhizobium sp. STM 3843]
MIQRRPMPTPIAENPDWHPVCCSRGRGHGVVRDLCQSRTIEVNDMMPLLRSATIDQPTFNDATRVRGLIDSLRVNLEAMTADIEAEERKSQISDVAAISYPILARSLRARRDNLEATINLLSQSLARFEG